MRAPYGRSLPGRDEFSGAGPLWLLPDGVEMAGRGASRPVVDGAVASRGNVWVGALSGRPLISGTVAYQPVIIGSIAGRRS